MFCSTGDKQPGVIQNAGSNSTDRCANVTLIIDIAVVKHRVWAPSNHAVALSLTFYESGADCICIGNLRSRGEAETLYHRVDAIDIKGIGHGGVVDHQRARPCATHTDDDHFVASHLYARRHGCDGREK